MQIVQVSGSSAGGVGRHVREISALLAASDSVLLAGPAAVVADAPPGVAAHVVTITDRPRPGDVAALRALRRLARGADVVHAHGLRAGALAVLATRGAHRPAVVVTLHNLPVGGRAVTGVATALEMLVARGADAVLTVSGDLAQRARRRGARRVAHALVPAPPRRPPAHTTAEVRERLGLAPAERLVLTIARLAPQKGLDVLCDTARLLARPPDRSPPVPLHWLVVGDGPLAEAVRLRITEERLPITLAGRRDDVPDLLTAADVVVSTSTWEGQPLAVQEALAAGAAIVATDVGGTREVTGPAADLVTPGSARHLAAAVHRVLTDPAHRDRLRQAARARAAELPGPADVVDQLHRLYREVAR